VSTTLLRGQLIGTWQLVRFTERNVETGAENFPFGEYPLGLILYTSDGYMSAQLQSADRAPFAEGDLLRATPEEYAAAGSSYVAYSGRFFVDETKPAVWTFRESKSRGNSKNSRGSKIFRWRRESYSCNDCRKWSHYTSGAVS
jgi:hypothetical protein